MKADLKIWIQAVRAPFFTASLIPVSLGACLIPYKGEKASWILLPVVILCSLLAHAATNIINDYCDFNKGIDKQETFGSSRVLVNKLLAPKQFLKAGIILFALSFALGLILIVSRGLPMLILALTGILGGYFYSAGPKGLKYMGLGDISVFLLMGPLMAIGSYYALTGRFSADVFFAALPIGFLVTAILHANNLRDIVSDKKAGITTLAGILGLTGAKIEYFALLILAYSAVLIMIARGKLSPWSFLVFLSAPLAAKNLLRILRARETALQEVSTMDVDTTKLHLLFGLLLIVSIILASFIR